MTDTLDSLVKELDAATNKFVSERKRLNNLIAKFKCCACNRKFTCTEPIACESCHKYFCLDSDRGIETEDCIRYCEDTELFFCNECFPVN